MKQSGFSLIEIVIVLGILVLVSAFLVSPFTNFRNTQILQVSVEDVLSTLNKARTQTLAGHGDSAYGVHLETNRVVLFAGETYNASDPTNQAVNLHSLVNISNISLSGGGSSVVFRRLTGTTTKTGTVTLSLASDSSVNKVITIPATGIAWSN